MWKKRIIVLIAVIAAFVIAGCGKSGSKDPLVGEWENDKDTVVFNADGTYSSYYYWVGNGQWSRVEGEEDMIEILHSLLGKEFHRVVIDGDDLELIQQYKGDDGSWNDTNMVYRLRKKGAPAKSVETEASEETVAQMEGSEAETIAEAPEVTEPEEEEKTKTETEKAEEPSEEIPEETEQEYPYGYIDKKSLPDNEDIIKELKDWLEEFPDIVDNQPDVLVDYIIDDFDGDGEMEGVACTTPAYNKDSVEEGWYDALYPATLWGYEKGEGREATWLSDFFYEKADGYVNMQEAYIQPGIKVLEVDFFATAHDVDSVFYIIDNENSRQIGSFRNGYVTDKGIIASDHDGYIYNLDKGEFETADVY